MKWINYNNELRSQLSGLYEELYSISINNRETNKKYIQILLSLKDTNHILYKRIIGMSFLDSYMNLKYRDLYNNLDDSEEATLMEYEGIKDIDELLDIIEENPEILSSFINAPLNFKKLNKTGKSFRLLVDNVEHMAAFSPLTVIERETFISNTTIDELVEQYSEFINENKNNAFSSEALIEEANSDFFDEIFIRSYGNRTNFEKLVISMIKPVYKWKKKIIESSSYYVYDIDYDLVYMIEHKSIDEIILEFINDIDFLTYLTEEYICFATKKTDKYEQELDEFYEKKISQDIKIKLKEV